jgi:hypothetical protein
MWDPKYNVEFNINTRDVPCRIPGVRDAALEISELNQEINKYLTIFYLTSLNILDCTTQGDMNN